MYDIAIIGGGPAGVSAAINAKLLNKNFIWLGGVSVSKKVVLAEKIKNYPGLPDISGENFGTALKAHTESMGIELTEKVVTGIYDTGGKYTLLAGDSEYEAKTVILCIGAVNEKPIEGENEFIGRGVSYCATCDGFAYKGKTIGVLCADKRFEHEVEYLCSLAEKVYVMPMYKNCGVKAENCEIILKKPHKISGRLRVESIAFDAGEIKADGIFILRNAVAADTLLHGLKTEKGHIISDKLCATNISGVFAAGDCTGRPYQYIKAAGEGNVAVHSAIDYLAKL